MSKVRVAINGFGRIGRAILRSGWNDPDIEWVAINNPTGPEVMGHLLKRDSVYGAFPAEVEYGPGLLKVDGKEITYLQEREPEKLPWKDLKIDVVLECTGIFRDREGCEKHIVAGARKVLLSAPPKGGMDFLIVKGVNEHDYDPKKHHIIANESCTTNCLAPLVKVINDNFKIRTGMMTTVHAYTANQRLHDSKHKDLRRARAAALNVIPTTTGASKAVGDVIPEIKDRLHGIAIRVPVPVGSLVSFTAEIEKSTTIEETNQLFKSVAGNELKGIVEYSEEPLVSTDILGNKHSSIFDAGFTDVICSENHCLLKVLAWYDNEMGYSSRMVDVAKIVGATDEDA